MKRKQPDPIPLISIPPLRSKFRTACQPTSFARKAISLLIPCPTRRSSQAERFGRAARNVSRRNKKGKCHHENKAQSIPPIERGASCYNQHPARGGLLPLFPQACVKRAGRARSADLQSAVSQVFNLPRAAGAQPSADCKSAIRQIKNLRYGKQILAQRRRGGQYY